MAVPMEQQPVIIETPFPTPMSTGQLHSRVMVNRKITIYFLFVPFHRILMLHWTSIQELYVSMCLNTLSDTCTYHISKCSVTILRAYM